MNLIQTAREYASQCHADCNQFYDDKPYAYHLGMVAQAVEDLTEDYEPTIRERLIAGAWCHDLIEDARQTYNDVKEVVGLEVAELAYALTNEKGRTREERANDTYYRGIKATPYATLIKICDRIANVRHSQEQQSRMYTVYQREYPNFKAKLYEAGKYEDAWAELDKLLN